MSDTVDPRPATDPEGERTPRDAESLADLAWLVLWDGVIGAVAGAGGNAVVLAVLFVASRLGGFDPAAFATLAELLGLDAVLAPEQLVLVGLALFVLGGMTTLPLLLVTVGAFLPGRAYATKGVAFGAILWTGFVLAYNPGYAGIPLAIYVVASFLGHLGYGYVTGRIMDVMFAEEGRPVVASSITAPADATQYSGEGDGPSRESTLVDDHEDEAGN